MRHLQLRRLHGPPRRQGGDGGRRRPRRPSRRRARGGDGVMEAATETGAPDGHVGRAIKRKEDPRFIAGTGTYTDDIVLPGMVYAAIVRSPEAHATITSIDTSAAARDDVVALYTGEDLEGDFAGPMPMVWAPPGVEVLT